LYGVLMHRRADSAKLVVTASFTSDAVAFARGKPIQLIDSDALLQLIRGVQTSAKIPPALSENAGVVEAPVCPKCGSKMVLKEARHGPRAGQSFWDCSRYPDCQGTRAC